MKIFIESNPFEVSGHLVPAFILPEGEMIRFWVESPEHLKKGDEGNWDLDKMNFIINRIASNGKGMHIQSCPNKIEPNFFESFRIKTVAEYLKYKFKWSDDTIEKTLGLIEIKPNYKIKELGYAHQKLLAILISFQSHQIITFDYFGLAPNSVEMLTHYTKTELAKGKSAISFSYLSHIPDHVDLDQITNLELKTNSGHHKEAIKENKKDFVFKRKQIDPN